MIETIAMGIGIAVLAAALGWIIGSRSARSRFSDALRALNSTLASGTPVAPDNGPDEVNTLTATLRDGWVPKGSEQEVAVRAALERVVHYLQESVERPLEAGMDDAPPEVRGGIDEALGAIADLEFFTAEPSADLETVDLGGLVREVTTEYSEDAGSIVRFRPPRRPIRVRVNPDGLKDALFLLLHNAGQFGGGEPVEVVTRVQDKSARLHVRDRGTGFSAEALIRAYDPFFTTLPGGLGLGLTHARRTIEGMGGQIHIRNRDDGGGEVEVAFELA